MTPSRASLVRALAGRALSCAEVAKLVDALDLGSSVLRRESSSLSFRTIISRFHRIRTLLLSSCAVAAQNSCQTI